MPNRQQAHTPGLSARTASAHEGEKRRTREIRRCRGNGGRAGEFTSQSPRGLELSGRGLVYERGRILDGEQECVKETTRRRNFRTSVVRARVCASCARIARNCLLVWGEEWAVAGSKYAQLTGNRRGWVEILDVEEAPGVLRHPNAAARFLRGGLLPAACTRGAKSATRKKRATKNPLNAKGLTDK